MRPERRGTLGGSRSPHTGTPMPHAPAAPAAPAAAEPPPSPDAPPHAPASYCDAARHPVHAEYHDDEHGFPVRDEAALFERLVLEINQAGLAWETVLRKRASLRAAYAGFDPERVAAFDDADRARLLADPGVIRNKLKVNAAIENARRVVALRATHGSFAGWLDAHHPQDLAAWRALFRATFVFTGGEIAREFLVSTGYLPNAHRPSCPAYARALAAGPAWARQARRA